jgi:hypothetical protein
MRPNIFKPFRALAKLADDSDKARINSAFAFFSMKRRIIAAMLAIRNRWRHSKFGRHECEDTCGDSRNTFRRGYY